MNRDMFNRYAEVETDFGSNRLKLQTGRIARQADGAVLASMGDIRVLAAVTARREPSNQNFFPLTVNYQERMYATGRIPGSFFRREGRPTEKETLTCRLIDRPIRPLFPAGFRNEVQVVVTVLSSHRDQNPDMVAMAATSAALVLSGVPFAGPMAACRVGCDPQSNEFLLNPTETTLKTSTLDMVVAGTREAVLMVESEARELPPEKMLQAVLFAHEQMQTVIALIDQLAEEYKPKLWPVPQPDPALNAKVVELENSIGNDIGQAYTVADKAERGEQLALLHSASTEMCESDADKEQTSNAFKKVEKKIVRRRILNGEPRIDGRNLEQVRDLDIEVGILPAAHGSALFTRGQTQTIATVTLGSGKAEQLVEGLDGIVYDRLMLHYNFPPFSVGETGFMGGPKRREIGHGRLARRSLQSLLPDEESFPYTIRIVSDITESNGSSSMASVCGGSLALMDAGVPMTAAAAGIAMGLVKEGDEYAILTDIMGDEDHLGDMDFKVAGTAKGLTALQMDIKITGVNESILSDALAQGRKAQLNILEQMNQVLAETRPDISERAPRTETLQVAPDQIRVIIGKGGATIRSIQVTTGTEVEVDDAGKVTIYGEDAAGRQAALDAITQLTSEPEIGTVYTGRVARVEAYGAFVTILPGRDGLVHISEIASGPVQDIHKHLSEGDEVEVKLVKIDEQGRLGLSMKALLGESSSSSSEPAAPVAEPEVGAVYQGRVVNRQEYGVFVNILPGKDGLVHISELESAGLVLDEGDEVSVLLKEIDGRGRLNFAIANGSGSGSGDAPRARREETFDDEPETLAESSSPAALEVGAVYHGKVVNIKPFGAFVNVLPGKDGLVHISEITNEHVQDVHDYLTVGDEVDVKLLEIDEQGRLRLSIRALQD